MNPNTLFANSCWFCLGLLTTFFIMTRLCKEPTYEQGVRDTMETAVQEGVALKEIHNDKIIYRFKELHKIGYEN